MIMVTTTDEYIVSQLSSLVNGRVRALVQEVDDDYPTIIYQRTEQETETYFQEGPCIHVTFYELAVHSRSMSELMSLEVGIHSSLHRGLRLVSMEVLNDDWIEEHEVKIRLIRVGIRN